MDPYLVLLRVEFTVPQTVTSCAVRSYRTLSPLPDPLFSCENKGHRRFALCCTSRRLTPPRRYLALCPMEPGLSSPKLRKRNLAAIVLANSAAEYSTI